MTTTGPLTFKDLIAAPDPNGTWTVWDNRKPGIVYPLTEDQLTDLVVHAMTITRALELFRSDVDRAVEALEDEGRDWQRDLENLTFTARCVMAAYDPSTWPTPADDEPTEVTR